jgi:DNA-binding CsgD family transcriptional regulator
MYSELIPAQQRLRGLTPRERQVLASIATGAQSHEIAAELGITVPTLKRHLANLYQKLQCSNRVQLSNLYHFGDHRGTGQRAWNHNH